MRVALVHDFLNQAGGAERVLAELHGLFPHAPIYTTILDRTSLWPALRDADIRTSWMQRLPGVQRHHRRYLALYPSAVESFDLRDYDVVISSSSAFAKAAVTEPGTFHLCYCHTPMRFAWEYHRYVHRERIGAVSRVLLPAVVRWLRDWDVRTSRRPDLFVANSSSVAERIRRHYDRPSEIVFPPVDTALYRPTGEKSDGYLVVSRLAPYKRVDVVVEAFNGNGRPLLIIGEGRDRSSLERLAKPNIRFLGYQTDEAVAGYYARARALICPGEEDFGITPLEANASGRPVIAYAAGGALDTVIPGKSGILFREQTADCIAAAVQQCEATSWDQAWLCRHAEGFRTSVFRERFTRVLEAALAARRPMGTLVGTQLATASSPPRPRMTVCLVTHVFARTDGQGRVNLEIARSLARRGHHVVAIGTAIDPELAREPNITWRQVEVPGWIPTALPRWAVFAFRSRRVLADLALPSRIVHLNGAISFYPADVNASHFVHAHWLQRAPRSIDTGWSWRARYHRFVARVSAYCERRAYHSAGRVVAVSDLVREALSEQVGVAAANIEVIPNGVDCEEFRPRRPGEPDRLREELGLPRDIFVALFVGDLQSNRKNLELPLRAMRHLGQRCHLAVAGALPGSPYPALARKLGVADRVHFLGARSDLPSLLRCGDAFALPSHYDPCPLVLLEAMASGLPVIATPMVGNSNLLRDGGGGFVLSGSGDEAGLVAALRLLAGNPEHAATMGQAARRTVEGLDWNAMALRYEDVYASLLAERAGGSMAAVSELPCFG